MLSQRYASIVAGYAAAAITAVKHSPTLTLNGRVTVTGTTTQDPPPHVMAAYQRLTARSYDSCLLKG